MPKLKLVKSLYKPASIADGVEGLENVAKVVHLCRGSCDIAADRVRKNAEIGLQCVVNLRRRGGGSKNVISRGSECPSRVSRSSTLCICLVLPSQMNGNKLFEVLLEKAVYRLIYGRSRAQFLVGI